MKNKQESIARGTGGHKAVFDISIGFKTELPSDDKAARGLIDALTDYIRTKAPGSSDPTVSVSKRDKTA